MKKIFVLMVALVAVISITVNGNPVDSTKVEVSAKVDSSKVDSIAIQGKPFSGKEYTVIAGTDTTVVKANGRDSIKVDFAASDSCKATGKFDYQNINGEKTKVIEVSANESNFWIPEPKGGLKADDKGNVAVRELACDATEQSDLIAPGWYGLISLIIICTVFGIKKIWF